MNTINKKIDIKKYAAIDIGSNAVRLLISGVLDSGNDLEVVKYSLVRIPIRLGQDVFVEGKISKYNRSRMIDAMKAFSLIMKINGIKKYKAIATSAMRNAKNGAELSQKILEKTGIDIEIIDGKKEAKIIFATDLSQFISEKKSYIYVDVGGGSTELTILNKGKIASSKSFKIGTVRLLNGLVKDDIWDKIKLWIEQNSKGIDKITTIASGGNINKVFKLLDEKEGDIVSFDEINNYAKYLKKLSFENKIKELKLKPDRADVIDLAMKIYISVMKWSKSKEVIAPKVGLSDGVIKLLHRDEI